MVETSRAGRRVAVFFIGAAFLLLLLGRWLKPVDSITLGAAAPLTAVVSGVSSTIGDVVSGIFEGPRLRAQNDQLRQANGHLLQQNLRLQYLARENQVLRRMVKYSDTNGQFDLVPARVIGNDPNTLAPYILIDRGTQSGLRQGMTVVDPSGYFVGTISQVSGTASKVLLMLSPSSSVGAVDARTRAKGLVEGEFAGKPQLHWVVASAPLRKTDFIVTSGQLNLYPMNILIGQVTRVDHRNNALFQSADIRPAADFQNLEMVQVVRNFVPTEPAKLLVTK